MNYIKETIDYLLKIFEWWIVVMPWEEGIRVRFGKKTKLMKPGVHLRFPFIDSCYIQTTRLRVVNLPPQTISTLDGKTLSIVSVIGFSIIDIEKLYTTLFHPDSTICNMALGTIADYVCSHNLDECSPDDINKIVIERLNNDEYGIKYEYSKIIGYAVVKTYRLLQDSHWMPNEINMNQKN